MLSRVAERVYWAARYLQRVEASARIVNAYTNLLLDLPKEVNISWFNLVTINNNEDSYDARYKIRDERNVVKFMLVDASNTNSMLLSLNNVRENLRTTRDVLPENMWEMINELSAYVQKSVANRGLVRAKRDEFLTQVINQCQMLQGTMASAMSRDSIWHMWVIGRSIERADMTTRLLEASAELLRDKSIASQVQAPVVIWGNVLRSASANHAYRRACFSRVKGQEVPKFLLFNDLFPRSVNYCLIDIKRSVKTLPKQKKVLADFKQLDRLMNKTLFISDESGLLLDDLFMAYINNLQIELANLHNVFRDTWFSID